MKKILNKTIYIDNRIEKKEHKKIIDFCIKNDLLFKDKEQYIINNKRYYIDIDDFYNICVFLDDETITKAIKIEI